VVKHKSAYRIGTLWGQSDSLRHLKVSAYAFYLNVNILIFKKIIQEVKCIFLVFIGNQIYRLPLFKNINNEKIHWHYRKTVLFWRPKVETVGVVAGRLRPKPGRWHRTYHSYSQEKPNSTNCHFQVCLVLVMNFHIKHENSYVNRYVTQLFKLVTARYVK
jgi:hypothetical protein